MEKETTFFLNDIHIPYQDNETLELVLRAISDVKPRRIVLNGDIFDCYQLSDYDKDPVRALGLQDDLDALHDFLRRLSCEVAPMAEIVYTEGNHEYRLMRYLMKNPEISPLKALKAEELFGLRELGIKWVPSDQQYFVHGVLVTHGEAVRSHGSFSAKAEAEKWGMDGISGHTHRIGISSRRTMGGEVTWMENGCLCDLKPEYAACPNWQQAFSVGTLIGGRFQIDQIRVVDHEFILNGMLYKG